MISFVGISPIGVGANPEISKEARGSGVASTRFRMEVDFPRSSPAPEGVPRVRLRFSVGSEIESPRIVMVTDAREAPDGMEMEDGEMVKSDPDVAVPARVMGAVIVLVAGELRLT
jgi:hypothetical protein